MRRPAFDREIAAIWTTAIFVAVATMAATWTADAMHFNRSLRVDGPDVEIFASRFARRLDDTASLRSATRAVLYLAGREGPWVFRTEGPGSEPTRSISRDGTTVDVDVQTPVLAPTTGKGVRAFLDENGKPVLAIEMTYRNQCSLTLATLSKDPYVGGRIDARIEPRNERIRTPAVWTPIGTLDEQKLRQPDPRLASGIDAVCGKDPPKGPYGPDEADEVWIRPRV